MMLRNKTLAMNEPLSKAYYLKKQLRESWLKMSKEQVEAGLDDWVEKAGGSKIPQLKKMAAFFVFLCTLYSLSLR